MQLLDPDGFQAWRARHDVRDRRWRFHAIFETPLDRRPELAAAIVGAIRRLDEAAVWLKQVVFDPKHLDAFLAAELGRPPAPGPRPEALLTDDRETLAALLTAALGDWIDLSLFLVPAPFALFADHDEYTTVYAMTRSNLNRVVRPLEALRVDFVPYDPPMP